jgi:hypothetical protein
MPVRQDKFKVGDIVKPCPNGAFYHKGKFVHNYLSNTEWIAPDQFYTVSKVVDVDNPRSHVGMGHTQHIAIKEDPDYQQDPDGYPRWSGKWWVLVDRVFDPTTDKLGDHHANN